MSNIAKKKVFTKAERDQKETTKKKKYVKDKENKIKREGEKIPRRLKHKGKINKFETMDSIAKARRGRIHDDSGIYKKGTSVKGQYFRTGLAREDILSPQQPSNFSNRKKNKSGQEGEKSKKTASNKFVENPSTKVNKARNKKLISPHPLAKQKQRKLEKIQIKTKKQPNRSYSDIRNRFELDSGGRNVLENKDPLITAQLEALQDEKKQKQIRVKPGKKLEKVPSEFEIFVENKPKKMFGVKLFGLGSKAEKPKKKPKVSSEPNEIQVKPAIKLEKISSEFQIGEKSNTEDEKPKKIHGVKLFGLGSKAEKPKKKPNVISEASQTVNISNITRKKIKQTPETSNKTSSAFSENSPFSKNGTVVARRIRKIPARGLKKHELVLEEIHVLPPITVKKKTLDVKYPETNAEKFDELQRNYLLFNSVITARHALVKYAKLTKKIFGKITTNIGSANNSENLEPNHEQPVNGK